MYNLLRNNEKKTLPNKGNMMKGQNIFGVELIFQSSSFNIYSTYCRFVLPMDC